jgi:hypothetical protein
MLDSDAHVAKVEREKERLMQMVTRGVAALRKDPFNSVKASMNIQKYLIGNTGDAPRAFVSELQLYFRSQMASELFPVADHPPSSPHALGLHM